MRWSAAWNPRLSYVSGTHFVPEMGIYTGWVALQGSSAAQQVFSNERQDVTLVLAGECFANISPQVRVETNVDPSAQKAGQWLIRLYEEKGDQFFGELNGLFAGVTPSTEGRNMSTFSMIVTAWEGCISARLTVGFISPVRPKRCLASCPKRASSMRTV